MLTIFRTHKNDEQRFRMLFMEMYPKLVRYAMALMGDEDEARDAVSDVFEQAWRRYATLSEDTSSAWFHTAVRNACLNRMKHLKVEQEHIETIIEATHFDINEGYHKHEALLQCAENIIHNLPEPTRSILRMCYWDKFTYKQVAEHFGISPDTVKKHISKALRTLREAIKDVL